MMSRLSGRWLSARICVNLMLKIKEIPGVEMDHSRATLEGLERQWLTHSELFELFVWLGEPHRPRIHSHLRYGPYSGTYGAYSPNKQVCDTF